MAMLVVLWRLLAVLLSRKLVLAAHILELVVQPAASIVPPILTLELVQLFARRAHQALLLAALELSATVPVCASRAPQATMARW